MSEGFEKFQKGLKHLFRSAKTQTARIKEELFVLTVEMEKEICQEAALHRRLKAIRELSDIVLNVKLEENAIEKLWSYLQDFLTDETVKENRHLVLTFFKCLTQGQYEKLGLMRVLFFNLVKNNDNLEDVVPKLELLQSLTDNGKDILYFEEGIGHFLLDFMPVVLAAGRAEDYLKLLVNVVKYNAAYIDEDSITGFVKSTCYMCCQSDLEPVVLESLHLLDTVVCYSNVPSESLPVFVATLCRTVNIQLHSNMSWKIMRNLLRTHMGNSSLRMMCLMLEDDNVYEEKGVIRGAIFFISAALWSSVAVLNYPPSTILPKLYKAAQCDNPLVLLEVSISMSRLIEKHSTNLKESSWDRVLMIMDTIVVYIEKDTKYACCSVHLHEALSKIEPLVDARTFNGDKERFFQFLERCIDSRPVSSVTWLMHHRASVIMPLNRGWMDELNKLLHRYFVKDKRTDVRTAALQMLVKFLNCNRQNFEKQMLEKIVIPLFQTVDEEKDIMLRKTAAMLLIQLCKDSHPENVDLLFKIIEKIVSRIFKSVETIGEENVSDVKTTIGGLINMFTFTMYHIPSEKCITVLSILTSFLNTFYQQTVEGDRIISARIMILDFILKLRSDSKFRLGYPCEDGVRYSSYLVIEHSDEPPGINNSQSSPTDNVPQFPAKYPCTHHPNVEEVVRISLSGACKVLVTALKREREWKVMQKVLSTISSALKHKALILSRNNLEVEELASALCDLVSKRSLNVRDEFQNAPDKFTTSEFRSYVFPALASFASFHAHLDSTIQKSVIKCFETGLIGRSGRECVTALLICILEMHDAMVKVMPEVLLNLSKMSATVNIAIPVLEFLSMMTTLPKLYSNFIIEQYMSVFAICLPYTNPFKFNHYTVSLAHHVIAVWFLKCKASLRKSFVTYIIMGLKSNSEVLFEEGHLRMRANIVNEDSSDRKRSSSLTEQGSRRKERLESSRLGMIRGLASDLRPPIDEKLMTFHKELMETCLDFMARYAFETYSALPQRHPSSDFILNGGQSMTWLLGVKLITVTTSGCTQKPINNNSLCDKCFNTCHQQVSAIEEHINKLERKNSSEDTDQKPDKQEQDNQSCNCWCQGWAEIHVRSPTGDVSWVMRSQNSQNNIATTEEQLCEMSTLNLASLITNQTNNDSNNTNNLVLSDDEQLNDTQLSSIFSEGCKIAPYENNDGIKVYNVPISPTLRSPIKKISELIPTACVEEDEIHILAETNDMEEQYDENEGDEHFRSPVFRSKSSPEMSSSWKSPFLVEKKEENTSMVETVVVEECGGDEILSLQCKNNSKQSISKETRGNCEAIPEEMTSSMRIKCGEGEEENKDPNKDPSLIIMTSNISNNESSKISITDSASFNAANPFAITRSSAYSDLRVLTRVFSNTDAQSNSIEDVNIKCKDVSSSSSEEHLPFTNHHDFGSFEFTSTSSSVSQSSTPIRRSPSSSSSINLHPTLTSSQPHLATKPPVSPPIANHSPRFINKLFKDALLTDTEYRRDRAHTISQMSSSRRTHSEFEFNRSLAKAAYSKEPTKSGINPSFIFLHLYYSTQLGNAMDIPLRVPSTPAIQRAISIFDRIQPYETHKVGVIYVGPGQAESEADIFSNQHGSVRYANFLNKLGTLIRLCDADPQSIFLGGLDKNGQDGKFAYIWKDDVMQVIFHVATLMPYNKNDPSCNNKKRHIGNDYVTVVYNESGMEYNQQTIKGQFNFACVIIEPLDHNCNQVIVRARDDLKEHIGHIEPKIISDDNVSLLARQLALHINLASMILWSLSRDKNGEAHASNWLERFRKIKNIRSKVLEEISGVSAEKIDKPETTQSVSGQSKRVQMCDFTEYT